MARTSASKSESRGKRRAKLEAATAKKFLGSYKEAWETRNAELAANLFTRDAHYWENPFGKPIVGREGIAAYWKRATMRQDKIEFRVASFVLSRYTLIAEWTCSYAHRPTGERRQLAGILLADFYGKQVRNFREYWHRRVA
jgi:hypothetical protein